MIQFHQKSRQKYLLTPLHFTSHSITHSLNYVRHPIPSAPHHLFEQNKIKSESFIKLFFSTNRLYFCVCNLDEHCIARWVTKKKKIIIITISQQTPSNSSMKSFDCMIRDGKRKKECLSLLKNICICFFLYGNVAIDNVVQAPI